MTVVPGNKSLLSLGWALVGYVYKGGSFVTGPDPVGLI